MSAANFLISKAKTDDYRYVDLDSKDIIKLSTNSISKGNQSKWYDIKNKLYIKEQFLYQGKFWKDFMIENLATIIANQCSYSNVVRQEIVQLSNGNYGTISDDFCLDGFQYIPISKFIESQYIEDNFESSYKIYTYLIEVMRDKGLDWSKYLNTMILMDFVLGNEDRHLNNFGVLRKDDIYTEAPLFDFGLGLFEHDLRYSGKSLNQCKYLMDGKPFSSDLRKPVEMLLNIDYDFCSDFASKAKLPERELFPSILAYEYMKEALIFLKGRCSY